MRHRFSFLAFLASLLSGAEAKDAPTALEASFKNRITQKLNTSVEQAAEHLVVRLALGGGPFGGYELDECEADKGCAKWINSCHEIDVTRDGIELCAMRQLHALTALCDVDGFLDRNEGALALVKTHLKILAKGEVPSLAMKKTKWDSSDLWMYRKSPTTSRDDVEVSPALQASVLMAMVRCADAIGQHEYFKDAESWFVGLQKVYPRESWNETLVSFHKSGIIWESLALVDSHLPIDSTFHAQLVKYIKDKETFLSGLWKQNEKIWSFASARAIALRWNSRAMKGKKKQRKQMRQWAKEHVDRFLGRGKGDNQKGLLDTIGTESYTCGPLQGLTAIASVLSDAELVQVVLQLLEKDVDKYQVKQDIESTSKFSMKPEEVKGSFFRDQGQMKLEKRSSLRVDDAVQCVIALTQMLRTLETIHGVEVAPEDHQATEANDEDASSHSAENSGIKTEL